MRTPRRIITKPSKPVARARQRAKPKLSRPRPDPARPKLGRVASPRPVVRFEAKHRPKRTEIKRAKRPTELDADQLERIKEAEFPLRFRRRVLKSREIEQLAQDAEMTVTAEEVEALWSQELLDLIQNTAIAFAEAATQPTADNNLLSSAGGPDRPERGAKGSAGPASGTGSEDTRSDKTGPHENGPGENRPGENGAAGDAQASLAADRGTPSIDRPIEMEPTQPGEPTMSADATSVEDTTPPQVHEDPPAPAAALAAEEGAVGDSGVAAPPAEPDVEPVAETDAEPVAGPDAGPAPESDQIDFDSLVDAVSGDDAAPAEDPAAAPAEAPDESSPEAEAAAESAEPTAGPPAPQPSPSEELPAGPGEPSEEPSSGAPVDEGESAGEGMAESMLFAESATPAEGGPDDATEAVVHAVPAACRDPLLQEIHSEVQQVGKKQDRLAASMDTVREDVRETRIDTSANTRATVEAIAALRVLQGRMLAAGSGRGAQAIPGQGQTYVVLCVALLAITWGVAFYLKTGDLTLALAGVLVANFLGCVAIYARAR